MPPVAGETASGVTAQVAERWAAIDPLLSAPSLPSGCGTDLVVTGAAGPALAVGACEHWVLLHYEQANPLSGPFWSHRGYRPLWTSWEARPARVIR
jgi:hypothetical protein